MVKRLSLYRGGAVLAVCGGITALAGPGLSAPGGIAPGAPRVGPLPPAVVKPTRPVKPSQIKEPTKSELPAVPPPGNEIMHISEVRPGMKGYGLTVFRGTQIERFEVDILGVMPKSNMGEPLVLVRLSGGPISSRGAYLIQGMSGSPIYVNGKLLGAFSMGNAWPKEPQGMVTPIDNMLEALDPKLSEVPAGAVALDPSQPAPVFAAAGNGGAGLFRDTAENLTTAFSSQTFKRLALPVTIAGLSGRNLDRAAELLHPFNMDVMQGPGSSDVPFKAELTPGAAIGVALMSGDVDMTGIGTVTYRKGNQLLAFGHPMMQIGPAQFPITTAFIHDVFPGFQISHKIGSAGELVGTLTQDRPFSIAAKVGALPDMVPVRCTVSDKTTGRSRTFNMKSASHPLLVGQLLPVAVNQAIFTMRPVPGDAVAHVKLTVETEGAGTITRENLFYDPQSVDVAAVRELQELMGLLSVNSFKRVPVKSLAVDVTMEDRRPTASVERIFLNRDKFEPGDDVEVGMVLRPYRKEPVVVRTHIRIPESAADGRALLLVQGGATRVNLGALVSGGTQGVLPASGPPPDATLKQVLNRFTTRERNDQLVARLLFPTAAVNVNGERLSQLPSTLVDVMRSSKTTGFRIERDEVKAKQDTDYVVDGLQTLAITIQRADHLEKSRGSDATVAEPTSGVTLGQPGGTAASPLSTGDTDEDSDINVVRFSVNGKPKMIRLTPEEDEPSEKESKKSSKPERVKAPKVEAPKTKLGAKPTVTEEEKPEAETKPVADEKLVGRAASVWTQTTQADFARGTFNNTAVVSSGEVRMAPGLKLLRDFSEQFVWSVTGVNGASYAGTGNTGLVLKVERDGTAAPFFRTGDLEVHALAHDKAGNLYAGTSPSGKVFRITPDGKGTELLSMNGAEAASEAGSKYVLSLAVADDGTVFAGTGPEGRVYRIPVGGKAEEYCTIPDKSVMSLLAAPGGDLYAGTAESGTIFRVRPSGSAGVATIIYDTGDDAITGMALDSTGNLFAAAAPSGAIYKIDPNGTPRIHTSRTKGPLFGLLIDAKGNLYSCSAEGGLRIEPDGTVVYLADPRKAQFTCLAWDETGHMVLGSSNVGSVYRLLPATTGSFESTVHDARLPARWGRLRFDGVLPVGGTMKISTRSGNTPEPDASWSQWQEPVAKDGGSYVASPEARFLQYRLQFDATAGDPSLRDISIAYLPRNQSPRLTLAAPTGGDIIHGSYSLKWSAVDPDKDTLTYEVFYSADGGATWKPVGGAAAAVASTAAAAPKSSQASAAEALQRYREQLERDASLTPAQRDESYNKAKLLIDQYLKENPSPSTPATPAESKAAPAAPAAAAKTVDGITRLASITWNTKLVPDGFYIVRVVATDRASNPSDPLQDVKITEPFIIANTAPQLFVFEKGITVEPGKGASVVGFAAGRVSIKGAQYRIGDGEWMSIECEDGIWDSAFEHFRFQLPAAASGEQTVEVKVVDVAGNATSTKVKYKSP